MEFLLPCLFGTKGLKKLKKNKYIDNFSLTNYDYILSQYAFQTSITATLATRILRHYDLIKIIASNKKLIKFIKWRPKFNNLRKIVKSCLKWERNNYEKL